MKHNNDDTFDLKLHMEDVFLDLKNTPDMGFEVLRAAVVEKSVNQKVAMKILIFSIVQTL